MANIRSMYALVCSLVLFVGISSVSIAQVEYHVSLTGSDANAGTSAAPFRTLAKALNSAITGAPAEVIVKITGGTYATAGVDVPASYTRNGIGDGTYLHIQGGYDATFRGQTGITVFTPAGLGPLDNAVEVNLAARQELKMSRVAVRGTGGVGLRVTSNPSGATLLQQAAAQVLIEDCAFIANFNGLSVEMSIGPNGGTTASTTFTMIGSEVVNNTNRGMILGELTNLLLEDVSIRGNGGASGAGLIMGSSQLREGLIHETEIINNHAGMELINVGTSPTVEGISVGLRMQASTLAGNGAESIIDNVRRLRLALGTGGPNPARIENRTVSAEGALTIENLRIEPYGAFNSTHWLIFENVGSSGFFYTVQDTAVALGPEIRAIPATPDAVIVFEGTDGDDTIVSRPIGGHVATEIMLAAAPTTIASRLRIIGNAVALWDIPLGNVAVRGGAGDDVMTVEATRLALFIDGGIGNDELDFQDSATWTLEQVAHTHLYGGPGNDTLTATTRTGLQRVIMEGGPNNDRVTGGDGDELVIWRQGDGLFWSLGAGAGTDTFRYIFDSDLGESLVVKRDSASIAQQRVGNTATMPGIGGGNQFEMVEVQIKNFSNEVMVESIATWVQALTVMARDVPLQATVQAFVPTTPNGALQSIRVMADESHVADSHLVIHGVEGETSRFDTQPLGFDGIDYTPGWVAVRTSGSSPLNVYNENMSTITMVGHNGDDLFVPQFWPITTQILEGGPGTDRILMTSNQQPYTAALDGSYTVLTRENFSPIRYTSIEVEDINPVTPPALPGDVNGDGIANVADVTMLAGYLFHGGPIISLDNADVNDDGDVDADDLDALVDLIVN